MDVQVVTIGTELLLSTILNTNAAHVARSLREARLDLVCQVTVGDRPDLIADVLRVGLRRADVVITIGGLGEHDDDRTRDAVASVTGRPRTAEAPGIYGARLLGGDTSYRPGFLVPVADATLICLPGRPRDLSYLWETDVLPFLQRRRSGSNVSDWLLLRTAGLMESTLSQMLAEGVLDERVRVTFASYAGQTNVRLWLEGDDPPLLAEVRERVLAQLGEHVFGEGAARLEKVVAEAVERAGITIALLEWHTQGRLSELLTSAGEASTSASPPAIIVYPLQSKAEWPAALGKMPVTPQDDLTRFCREAAEQARQLSGRDLGLVLYRLVRPGGIQLLVTLASDKGISMTQRSFGGHPDNIEDWGVTLALVHLRRWLMTQGELQRQPQPHPVPGV